MSKVIFFIRPMHGHVNPTLKLVKELVERGEAVIYYTTKAFREKIWRTGAVCRFYKDSGSGLNMGMEPNINPKYDKQEIGFQQQVENVFGDFAARMEDVKNQEKDLYQELKAEKPDYSIYDYVDAFWGKILAKKLHIPAIASIPSFAICPQMIQKDPMGLMQFFFHISPHESPIRDAADLKYLIDIISNRIESAYHIKDFNLLNYGNSEHLNIIYNSRYFQPCGEVFDETFKFIGCTFDRGPETVYFPYDQLHKNPIIFISLGTNYNQRIDFYKKCFQAFSCIENQVVLSVGSRIDLALLGTVPRNFIIRRFVPQLDILQRSGLFITHGGLNSAKEGIFYCVPLLVFPQQGDQFAVGHQVNHLGAGICIDHDNITGSELREVATKLFNHSKFHQNCKIIKETFEQCGGVKMAADEIFKLKEKIGIQEV